LLGAFLLVAILPLLVQGFLYYSSYRKGMTRTVRDQLESVASIQQSRLSAILQQNEERLALVASRTQLRISLRNFLASDDEAARDRMVRILNDAAGSIADLVAITVYSPEGIAVASTRSEQIGQPHFDPELFRLSRETDVVDRIYLAESGESRAYLTGPVSLDGQDLGVIVLRSDVKNLLASLFDYAGLGDTGESVLLRPGAQDGYVFLAPTRFDPHAALQPYRPGAAGSDFLSHRGGGQVARDYRGQEVLAVTRKVPGTDWILAVKVDRAEAFRGLDRLARFSFLMLGLLLAVTVVVAVVLARSLSAPLVRLSRAAEAIAAGDYDQKLPVRSRGEVGVLEESFNNMSSRIVRAMAEIKTLEGIIPICASCKKIRDDKGYWTRLEAYLAEHSEAMFSHGICPECLQELEKEIEDL
jgi:HAMP domain-containing protein